MVKKNMTLHLEIEIMKQVKHYCIEHDTNFSELVNSLLVKFINSNKEKNNE